MPELGSKISLISKADIRYEGRLFTVDPNECTIALASVRSFGTEDRETQFPIAAQNQVYDYILFRGSDIKDIRVCNPTPVPNDPAIMQMHLPPQQGVGMPQVGGQAPFQPPHFPPMGGAMMPGQPNPGPFGGPFGGMGAAVGQGMPGGQNAGLMAAMLEFIGGGSRSTTPHSLISRKSPCNDMGVQAGSGGGSNQNQSRESNGKRNNSQSSGNNQQQGGNQMNRRDSGRNQDENKRDQQQVQGAPQRNQHNSNGQFNNKYQRVPQQQQQQQHQQNPMNNNNANRMGGGGNGGGWIQRGGPGGMQNHQMRGQRGGRLNTRTMNNPQFRQMNPNMKPRVPGKPIKFESDYDFEQANSKFEELFAKLKVGDTSANPEAKNEQQLDSQINGEVVVAAAEKKEKDDSGNETGAGEHEPEEEHDGTGPGGYDKTKSFFDNISCEAQTDRKGKPRVDWRQERKLNSETFGVSSTRRGGMGGYRGRGGHNYNQAGGYFHRGNGHQGGYRNNNGGGGGNGGYRNNYRRNNNGMRMNGTNPASTGIPTVTKQPAAGPSSAGAAQTVAQVVAAQ